MAGVIVDPDAYDRDPRYRRGMHAAIRRLAYEIETLQRDAAARTGRGIEVAPVDRLEVLFFGFAGGLMGNPGARTAMLRRIEAELEADGEPIALEEYVFKTSMERS